MMQGSRLRAAALASSCLLPLAAAAQEIPQTDNEATIGVRVQSVNSALFGRYNGFPYDGVAVIGGFRLESTDPWNSGKVGYFTAEGDGIDIDRHQLFPDASLSAKYGERGKWEIAAYYQGIPYWQSLTYHSVLDSNGQLKGLTAGSVPVNTGINFTPLSADPATGAITSPGATTGDLAAGFAMLNGIFGGISRYDTLQAVGSQRDIIGGSASFSGWGNWSFGAELRHEHKQGTKETSFATNDMNNIVSFPEPVNWDTDRYSVSAKYNGERLQGIFSYSFSKFTDNQAAYTASNPFDLTPAMLQAAPGYLASVYSLPPSNDAHQLKGLLGYMLTPTTRINANFGYELLQQNASNPLAYLGAPSNPYLPSGNYSATIQQFFGNIVLTSRPFAKADFRASYTIDDRMNDSQRVFIPADFGATGQITADTLMSTHVPVANLPISALNQTARIEAGYRILNNTKITASFTYQDKQRDFSVTDRNHESTGGVRVNSTLADGVTGLLGYTHSDRTAAAYYESAAWAASTYPLTNPPGLGLFYVAARVRDEAKGMLTWRIDRTLSAGLTAKYYDDHYPDSFYGVSNDHKLSVGPDITYSPSKAFSARLSYTFEEVFLDQRFTNNQDPAHPGQSTDWTLGNKDTIHSVSAVGDWQVSDKLKLSLTDDLSYGATAFNEASVLIGSPGLVQPAFPENVTSALPSAVTLTNSISLKGEYELSERLSLLGSYGFARAIAKDYLYGQPDLAYGQSFGANGTSGDYVQLLGGDGNPSYSVHVISLAARLKW